ncbi:MAG: RNase III inhibitor [Ruminococcaceae bacterium]|nr:RNase III inhibitor [Oscillospiraceae bacterium]
MPLKLIREDITRLRCDAVVNPTNEMLEPGGGVDAALHHAAGPQLLAACRKSAPLRVGAVAVTPGFALPAKYVIHTVGPLWRGGTHGEREQLASCYSEALSAAAALHCESIAFPLIASGTLGYPKGQVLRVATEVIEAFLRNAEMTVYIVVYDKTAYEISQALFSEVTAFVDDHYVEALCYSRSCRMMQAEEIPVGIPATEELSIGAPTLEEALAHLDRGFAETLFFYIDQKGLTDVECYKRANVDKKTFSKIKCNKQYRPSKVTAVSFAIALRLSPAETEHLLNTAGMALSRSSKFDVIIEYFITTGNYKDIFEVNEALYQFDQQTLGV